MATAEQRARRRAQRETAKAVQEARKAGYKRGSYKPRVSQQTRRAVLQGQIAYAERVLSGEEPRPAPGTPEAKQLARMAANAHLNKIDPKFKVFEIYFYHKNEEPEEDEELDEE